MATPTIAGTQRQEGNEQMLVNGWIDTHAHFYPPQDDSERIAQWELMKAAAWQLAESARWDPDSTLAYMDRTGVAMQLLSNIPKSAAALQASNEYAATLVAEHPTRFGLLAALPTDDCQAALAEAKRAEGELRADGYAVTCRYNGVYLSDARLEPLWAELDRLRATVFVHPDANAGAEMGRPPTIIDVAFETARTVTDMLYKAVFRRYPNIRFVIAHCGGALPALSGRLELLGLERWVPNPAHITPTELRQHLRRLYLDTAAVAPTGLGPGIAMVGSGHLLFGSDCGRECTTDATMDANLQSILAYRPLSDEEKQSIGRAALGLYPRAAERLAQ
jgi:predicted TIM-barrel fold metal-dependent hydrolase